MPALCPTIQELGGALCLFVSDNLRTWWCFVPLCVRQPKDLVVLCVRQPKDLVVLCA